MKYTYCLALLGVISQSLNLIKSNYLANGIESIVSYQNEEEDKPQLYKITITPIADDSKDKEE